MIGTRENAVETMKTCKTAEAVETGKIIETAEANKNGKKSKDGENPKSNLTQVPCIWYPIIFWKKNVPMLALFDSNSKINAIYLIFSKELGLSIRLTDVRVQKIDGITLDTFEMVVAAFSIADKANQIKFFEETFLVANVSSEIVHGMFFFTLSCADVNSLGWKLR